MIWKLKGLLGREEISGAGSILSLRGKGDYRREGPGGEEEGWSLHSLPTWFIYKPQFPHTVGAFHNGGLKASSGWFNKPLVCRLSPGTVALCLEPTSPKPDIQLPLPSRWPCECHLTPLNLDFSLWRMGKITVPGLGVARDLVSVIWKTLRKDQQAALRTRMSSQRRKENHWWQRVLLDPLLLEHNNLHKNSL